MPSRNREIREYMYCEYTLFSASSSSHLLLSVSFPLSKFLLQVFYLFIFWGHGSPTCYISTLQDLWPPQSLSHSFRAGVLAACSLVFPFSETLSSRGYFHKLWGLWLDRPFLSALEKCVSSFQPAVSTDWLPLKHCVSPWAKQGFSSLLPFLSFLF